MLVNPFGLSSSLRHMRGGGAVAGGGVYGTCSPETSGAGGRAVEGGAQTTSGSQSGAGTADSHIKAGTTGQSGENQQVGVFSVSVHRLKQWLICTLPVCLHICSLTVMYCNVSVYPQAPAWGVSTAAAAMWEQRAHSLPAEWTTSVRPSVFQLKGQQRSVNLLYTSYDFYTPLFK